MCGIAGIVTTDGQPVDTRVLTAMREAMISRGPDGCGLRIDLGVSDEQSSLHVGFAHRRLSIIDLSDAATQPMSNEDGSLWLTFNGEIYNFQPLREELLRLGHVFRSRADTEVVLHGYEEYGPEILSRLNGMFAFALWDRTKRALFLARDRFGKKPLYYYLHKHGLSFASQLTALMRDPTVPAQLDLRALGRYLAHEYVPAPDSILQGVRKLEPAQSLLWTPEETRLFTYWRPRFSGSDCSFTEAAQKFRELFIRAVERRLISDVPLGVFLSGGIDSSSVIAAMRECMDASAIQTFSIGFQEKSFDESGQARETASFFGTRHHGEMLTAGRLPAILPEVADFLDEPLADASILPTYLLCGFARKHVTVALGGDGGDELLAGYDPFAALWAAEQYERLPAPLKRGMEGLANRLPVSAGNMSLDFKIKQFFKGCRHDRDTRLQAWMAAFRPEDLAALFTPDAAAEALAVSPLEGVRAKAREAWLGHRVDAALHYYMSWYLPGAILTKVDRASMAVSLEARAPFLDVEVAEFVNALPPQMKLYRGARKRLLREAFKDALPPSVLRRPKKGFGIPLTSWLKGELLPELRRVLAPERIRREGLFRPETVERLEREHLSGKVDHRKALWTLLMFQKWREKAGMV